MPTVAAVLEFPARKAPPRRHRADRTFLTREELGRLMAPLGYEPIDFARSVSVLAQQLRNSR
jgi:hypothetical protein